MNLEYLGQVVFRRERDGRSQAYPDTLVGTDSHTTMINGLGVLGWGVGGIEAEAAMLGQPISMLLPQVVGFRLTGELSEGATATDLVLTVTEMLRERGVVGKFVEFFGPGLHTLGLADRATIGNMSPEFGSTCAIFPVDRETLRYLEFTGRPTDLIELVDAYAREQGLFHAEDSDEPTFSETLELDLSGVEPSIAGPKRPQDRIPLADAKAAFLESLREFDPEAAESLGNSYDEAVAGTFPASDPTGEEHNDDRGKPRRADTVVEERHPEPVTLTLEDGTETQLDHGRVVIAAITSCTNTSNPTVMVGAGLLAKKAVERGLESQALGEDVAGAGLDRRHRVPGPGRPDASTSTSSGSTWSGTGAPPASATPGRCPRRSRRWSTSTTSSSARCCPAIATSRAGSTRTSATTTLPRRRSASPMRSRAGWTWTSSTTPSGEGSDGEPVYLRDVWPSGEEVKETVASAVRSDMFTKSYDDVFTGDERWSVARDPRGRSLRVAGFHVRSPPAVLRRDGARAGATGADRRSAGAGRPRRQRHHGPHLAGRRDQEGQPGRALADRSGGRGRATSTPTARGGETTR